MKAPLFRFSPGTGVIRSLSAFSALVLFSLVPNLHSMALNAPPPKTFTNPILGPEAGADPAVILHNETYYLYTTNRDNAVFTSRDLVHWEKGSSVLPESFKGMWAPEVYHHPEDGKFYLYYTLKYKIGVAVSGRPEGPFTDLGFLAIPGIDAHLFRDDDARLYLYFTHTPAFSMYVIPMKSPTETGGPVTQCFEISQDWEKHSHHINEGPWMEKRDGKYTLLYSGSNGQSTYYAVGVALAPTPIGPFTKLGTNPVFQDLGRIHGPGHGSIIRDRVGQLWHVHHQKLSDEIGWKRDLCLDPMNYDSEGILRGKPTRGVSQPAPVCDPDLVWSPDIHPRGAVFSTVAGVLVTMTCRTPGAEIRYTVDGSEPGPKSPLYQTPFPITSAVQVRARSFKKGMKTSTIANQKFTPTDQPLPPNPSPDASPGDPPFDVFPRAIIDWKPHAKKQKPAPK
jgi:xylan 1,4-beta-xylosidase